VARRVGRRDQIRILVVLLVRGAAGYDRKGWTNLARLNESRLARVGAGHQQDRSRRAPCFFWAEPEAERSLPFVRHSDLPAEKATVRHLRNWLSGELPKRGHRLYPMMTRCRSADRISLAEMTREKLTLRRIRSCPTKRAVKDGRIGEEKRKDGSARIDQLIYVMPRHKGSSLGSKGKIRSKPVSRAAREEIGRVSWGAGALFLQVRSGQTGWKEPERNFRNGAGFKTATNEQAGCQWLGWAEIELIGTVKMVSLCPR